jgi:plasmid stabilization system protein ParE
MAKKINWTFSALQMLNDIHSYIASYNEDKADNYIDIIFDFCNQFATFPEAYPRCRFAKLANNRCAVFDKQYIIVYSIDDMINILAIMHSSRSLNYIENLGNEEEE